MSLQLVQPDLFPRTARTVDPDEPGVSRLPVYGCPEFPVHRRRSKCSGSVVPRRVYHSPDSGPRLPVRRRSVTTAGTGHSHQRLPRPLPFPGRRTTRSTVFPFAHLAKFSRYLHSHRHHHHHTTKTVWSRVGIRETTTTTITAAATTATVK